ncbi:unnamed protein product [Paramecium sonneborni]|uniref:Uncharacterized protein n=1 Tax=Paramecium sonneborni TaxID=65129 RepID=A0A8S1RTE7_9CILI|nr:unnamed protein product [Paramecium sonneborni]
MAIILQLQIKFVMIGIMFVFLVLLVVYIKYLILQIQLRLERLNIIQNNFSILFILMFLVRRQKAQHVNCQINTTAVTDRDVYQ